MNYDYVKKIGNSFEFIQDGAYEFDHVNYSPHALSVMSTAQLSSIGLKKTVLLPPPTNYKSADGTMYFNELSDIVEYRPNYILYTESELIAKAMAEYDIFTVMYIQNKIDAYNTSNGLSFANIDSFVKYTMIQSDHSAIAVRFITYADSIWKSLRAYQKTLTSVPTEAQVKAVLDNVVF